MRKLSANFYIVLIFTLLLTLSYVQQVAATSTANCCHFVGKVGAGLMKVANRMCGRVRVPFVVVKGVRCASVCVCVV